MKFTANHFLSRKEKQLDEKHVAESQAVKR
jgi:hypothetical protein